MVPVPVALGLILCEKVIVEKGTEAVSLIGTFNRFQSETLPITPYPFYVFATLTGGYGDATIHLTITRLETDEEIFAWQREIHFPDRFTEIDIRFHLESCEFDAEGIYLFNLLVDGDWVAHRRVKVHLPEKL
jgi:hypothetical protein